MLLIRLFLGNLYHKQQNIIHATNIIFQDQYVISRCPSNVVGMRRLVCESSFYAEASDVGYFDYYDNNSK